MKKMKTHRLVAFLMFLSFLMTIAFVLNSATGTAHAAKDAGHGHDYRTFHASGNIDYGKIGDSYTAELSMYLAGNQFMVMEDLIKNFQSKNTDIKTVYVETIPPGQILKKQLLKQGEVNGEKTSMTPDLFASVNINHLRKLKGKGLMNEYIIYTHNKLELMVAKGNPKKIKGPEDLGRDDIVQSHPNPLTEGIFKFYGSEMLKDLKLYEKVTANAKCKSCWAVEGKTWFTSRHHRETPHRIENGDADTGIVWTTEVAYAKQKGRPIEGVAIPAPYNKQDKVGYAIGPMLKARNVKNAQRFLTYLATKDAQDIYAGYGFVPANSDELKIKALTKK
ncbi:ABC transporter, substrate-binding protein (cluster 6, sulfate/molybdate/tungstate/phosphate) [hydrothermal vent metagenome]|uniref:ABC transporter, substrate-binding protein (Cluster 6, sulfate/molybdate/tungstate/phosphate) n=1 Tax=hydrothermal vent metagenome TaxID=652676 RepID=A0A3B0W3N8_9ZZZZ